MDLTIRGADDAPDPCLHGYPDVYFTPGYGVAAASTEGGIWQYAEWAGKIALPYVLRQVTRDAYDVVNPYGYSGIHVADGCGADELAAFWGALRERWHESGVVTAFLRFSPLDPRSVEAVRDLPGIDLTRRGDTITIRVDRSAEALWRDMTKSARWPVRKAGSIGLTAEVRVAERADLIRDSAFRRLYQDTMTRVGSSSWYLFSDEYYELLIDGLRDGLHLAEARDDAGKVVATYLLLTHGDRVHYHLSASVRDTLHYGANNLLLWTLLEWARESGRRLVHLGGGVEPDDSLFRFKKSFGGERTQFWTAAAVLDQSRYDELVADHAVVLGVPLDQLRSAQFFPQYRMGTRG